MNNENFDLVTNDENEEFTVEFGEVINDGGTHDYNELDNQPQINGHTLEGNKTNEQLGIPVYTEGTGIKLSGDTISADTDVLATKADLNSKQNVIADLPQIRSGAEAGATAVQPEDLARIATTGSYNDSLDKPSINNVELVGNKTLNDLGIVTLDEFYKAFPTDTASGAVTSFTDGADNLPLKSLVVNINPVQDLSQGDPSPENVCPISGWTGMNVSRRGKNFFPPLSSETRNGVTIAVADDGTITINGTASVDTYFDKNFFLKWKQGDSISVYGFNPVASPSNRLTLFVITSAGNPQANLNSANAATTYSANADTTVSRYRLRVPSGVEYTNFVIKPMLCINFTATSYEPYNGINLPISWQTEAGTVYGGKLDVLTGKLTVDMAMPSLDAGTVYRDNGTYKIWMVKNLPRSVSVSGGRAISNITKTFGNVSSTALETRIQLPSGTQQILFASIPTGFNIADVQVAYELATPIEIQLDPHEINTLLGVNNIWADTGDTEVEYRADTKLYINKMIGDAETISTRLASSGRETALYKGAINPIETNIPIEEEEVEYEKT